MKKDAQQIAKATLAGILAIGVALGSRISICLT